MLFYMEQHNNALNYIVTYGRPMYTVNQKKTWQFIFDYNFGES